MEDLYILALEMKGFDNGEERLLTSILPALLIPTTAREQQIK